MENATKALLIAAAVLIAIVLIALGVNLLSSARDTSGQAEQAGSAIENGVGNASDKAIGSLNRTMTAKETDDFIKEQTGKSLEFYLGENYENYSYRVYENNNNENINEYTAVELWEKSKVVKEMPSGYVYQNMKWNSVKKICIITIKPEV